MAKMRHFYTFITLCLLAIQVQTDTQTLCLSETCAQQLVDRINWTYRFSSIPDDPLGPEQLLRAALHPSIDQMERFDWKNFQSPLLKRQFEILHREFKHPVVTTDLSFAADDLRSLGNKEFLCDIHQKSGECNKSFNKLNRHDMVHGNDLNLIAWNWAEWRNKMPAKVKKRLHYLIEYYQNMSTPAMPASAVWYEQYEDKHFFDDLESAMQTIAPFYSQMHAHLRHSLRLKYGDNVIPASGLIPHHLMEQAFYQSWKKDSVLSNPYPHKKLPNMQHELDDFGIDSFKFINASVQFFGSMGFDIFNDEYMRSHFVENGSTGPDCKGSITNYPEIMFFYCRKNSYKRLLTMHGDIARVEYAHLTHHLPVGLNREACPGFSNAIAEAVILSASTPKHLQNQLGLLTDYNYDEKLNLNFLYRMAVHALLSIPTYFVHEKLWLEMIDKKITPEEYNCRYWDLMAQYMGVSRPSVHTNPGVYEMPYKFYEGVVEVTMSTKKLFGEFFGYQLYRDICLAIGEFQPGNPDKILQKCDFANNKRAGDLLKGLMTSGSTKPWRELIATLTPSHVSKLQGTAFLDYYAPLNTWITKYNADNNIQVGWMQSTTCPRSH